MTTLTTFGQHTLLGGARDVLMGHWQAIEVPPREIAAEWLQRVFTPYYPSLRIVGYCNGVWGHQLRLEFWTEHGDFVTVNYHPQAQFRWPGTWEQWLTVTASAEVYIGPAQLLQTYLQQLIAIPNRRTALI